MYTPIEPLAPVTTIRLPAGSAAVDKRILAVDGIAEKELRRNRNGLSSTLDHRFKCCTFDLNKRDLGFARGRP